MRKFLHKIEAKFHKNKDPNKIEKKPTHKSAEKKSKNDYYGNQEGNSLRNSKKLKPNSAEKRKVPSEYDQGYYQDYNTQGYSNQSYGNQGYAQSSSAYTAPRKPEK